MSFKLPVDPREERRARYWQWASLALSGTLVALLVYLAYGAWTGSEELVHPERASVCRLPASLGWTYVAINYDQATDAALAAEPDADHCSALGQAAGSALVAEDGVPLAGWYIPAASGAGPEAPTVVLVHGHGSNKNRMLPVAEVLHPTYNLVLFDLRNSGQSGGSETTLGVRERLDLEAVVAWLATTHAPAQVAVLGSSMGGITATNAVAADLPVQALILDSTPARTAESAQRRVENMGYPLSLPVSWAVMLGTLFRTGVDVTAADPVLRIDDVAVPVLILQGDADSAITPDSATLLADAALAGGGQPEVEICAGAEHSQLVQACPDAYREWVLGFLARSLGSP
jgi:pimeloyl-ACP methyl ester carboxylesterase